MDATEGCQECPADSYSARSATSCTYCAAGQLSPPGSTSSTDCRNEGEFGNLAILAYLNLC